jgi:hypothetical protein
VLAELVLSSEHITKAICERVGLPVEHVSDPRFLERISWKLGFNLPRFDDNLTLLRQRLDTFYQELLAVGSLRSERDRERIRSAGVNLFVSIEQFLQQLVCYNVWLLASDHFIDTKFTYDLKHAMAKVSDVLGRSLSAGNNEVRWKTDGENPLGTLVAYLNASSRWMTSLLTADRDLLLRAEVDLPHFVEDKFRVFPYVHIALWADADHSALKRHVDSFQLICSKVFRSNLASIRNGLDHQRDEQSFPKIEEMLVFIAHFREAVDGADVNRYVPKEFWLESTQRDRFGRSEHTFRDYAGRTQVFYGPSFIHVPYPPPDFRSPRLIAPGNLTGYSNGEMVFRIREPSLYASYWAGYPRRRRIPSPHSEASGVVSSVQGDLQSDPATTSVG